MNYVIRPAVKDDEPFLWEMLYYAAHVDEEGERSPEAAKKKPELVKYVRGWGNEMDVGCIALEPESNQRIGAAWLRLFSGDEKMIPEMNDCTPELAIAVRPDYSGRGVGTQLLMHVLEAAKKHHSAVALSVRVTNPARQLYERLGFVVVGKTTNRVGTESLIMLIDL